MAIFVFLLQETEKRSVIQFQSMKPKKSKQKDFSIKTNRLTNFLISLTCPG